MFTKLSRIRPALTIALLAGITVLPGCDKDDDDDNSNKTGTITEVVVGSQDFSTLESAVVKANLQETLSGTGPFTVFAPDNDAFSAAGITGQVLNSLSQDQVAGILLYHTIGAKIAAADVPAGPNASVTTAGGDSVFVTKKGSAVYINGIMVEEADIAATNGVIHRINGVLLPPTGNMVEVAQEEGNGLDSLVKAVLRANNEAGGDPQLVSTLHSAILTLFAPNNDAFTDLLSALQLDDINEIPIATLVAVLKYHVVGGRAFSSDLVNGTLATVGGGNVTVNVSGSGASITGSGNNGQASGVVKANIMARNGVVHVIDKVLLP